MSTLGRIKDGIDHFRWQRFGSKSVSDVPHVDADTLRFFDTALADATLYMEYGCGGSTVRAAGRRTRTVAVDNDRFFVAAVRQALPADADTTITVVDTGFIGRWGRPVFQSPSTRRLARWRRYCEAPFAAIDAAESPDFVLIDGRFRVACAAEVVRQVSRRRQPLTLLIDDYFGNRHYSSVERFLGDPQRHGRSAAWRIEPQALRHVPDERELLGFLTDVA